MRLKNVTAQNKMKKSQIGNPCYKVILNSKTFAFFSSQDK